MSHIFLYTEKRKQLLVVHAQIFEISVHRYLKYLCKDNGLKLRKAGCIKYVPGEPFWGRCFEVEWESNLGKMRKSQRRNNSGWELIVRSLIS